MVVSDVDGWRKVRSFVSVWVSLGEPPHWRIGSPAVLYPDFRAGTNFWWRETGE